MNEELPLESFDVIVCANVLCYIKEDTEVINRVYSLLKSGGVFVSATDCLGENNKFSRFILKSLSKIGLLPQMNMYKTSDLENLIKVKGLEIIEAENLYTSPPNYFIVAQKN